MTVSGTVSMTIPAGAAQDLSGNPSLASTSTDNTVTYTIAPAVTWTGGSAVSNNWSDDANWGGAHLQTGADIVFLNSSLRPNPINDLPAGTSFKSITFSGGGFTVTGNALTLSNATPITNSVGTNSLNVPYTLAAPSTISVANGTTLNLGGTISLNGFALTVANVGTCNLNAPSVALAIL
jgi:hypothetical protein